MATKRVSEDDSGQRVDLWQLHVSIVLGTSQPNSSNTTTASGSIDAVVSDSEPCPSQLLQDSSSSQPVLQQFAPFPKLPIEIRLMIWVYALLAPRNIELCRRSPGRKWLKANESITDVDDQHRVSSQRPRHPVRIGRHTPESTKNATSSSKSFKLPILLRTSKEAREFGLQRYELIFRESMGLKPLYIDFSRDTLAFEDVGTLLLFLGMEYIDTEYLISLSAGDIQAVLKRLKHPMLKELRYLAIGGKLTPVLMKILPVFQKLAHITLKDDEAVSIHQEPWSPMTAKVKDLMKIWQDIAGIEGYDFKEPEFEFLGNQFSEFSERYEFKCNKRFTYSVS